MLLRLTALSDEYSNRSPDAITLGDVWALDHYDRLRQIADSAFRENEHAA